MTPYDLEQIIQQGEGLTIEFKQARNGLPRDLFETVCAFLNRKGGHLVLGVQDNGTVIGVEPEQVEQLKKDFTTLSNNPNKLNPPFLLEFTEIHLQDRTLLYVYVPESSQAHRCDNVVYDRRHEGDFRVIDNANISSIYGRKSSFYSESRIYPHLGLSEFQPGILDRVRQLIRSRASSHPWLSLSNLELIRSAGLYRKDYQTGAEGCTLAAALLLGREDVIHSILPHYRIDALVRQEDVDRYDDRLDIRTNLIEAFDMLMLFVTKHLPERFFLQGDQRINLRDIIFREIVANLVVHREYTNATPARFVIFGDRVETDNANKPSGYGPINPDNCSPFPKNPSIAKFFVQLGQVEELGSGIRNVTRLLKYYCPNRAAQFIEEDVFRAIVPFSRIKEVRLPDIIESLPPKKEPVSDKLIKDSKAIQDLIARMEREIKKVRVKEVIQQRLLEELTLFATDRVFSATELSMELNVHSRTIRRDFSILLNANFIQPADSFGFYRISDTWSTS